MRNIPRYLLILTAALTLSVLLLPGSSSATREAVKSASAGKPSSARDSATLGRPKPSAALDADLIATKMSSSDTVSPGSNLTYTIEVTNLGPDDASSVTLTDTLPAGTTFVSLTQSSNSWSCQTPSAGAGGTVTCTNATLAAGTTDSFTLVVNVDSSTAPGTFITNTATVSSPDDFNDENNTASATSQVAGGGAADLGVTKLAGSDTATEDTDVTYTIQVVNNGPSNANNATLTDTLPGTMTFVSFSQSSNAWSCTTPAVGAGGTVTCTNPSLAVGSNDTFTLVAHVPSGTSAGTTYDNQARVSTSTTDSTPENDTSTASVTVASCSTNIVVFNNADSGQGSLRQAILDSCSGATITFDSSLVGPITLTSGGLVINKNLTIQGPGANLLTVQRSSTAPKFVVFTTSSGTTVNISGVTVSGGNAGPSGGGVKNSTGTLTLMGVAVSGNSADNAAAGVWNEGGTLNLISSTVSGNSVGGDGAGAYNASGTLNITNSTVSGNSAGNSAGGIFNSGTLTLTNSTVSGNSAPGGPGGIRQSSGTAALRNTIVAGNTAVSSNVKDLSGAFTSQGHNLIGDNTGSTGFTAGTNNPNGDQVGTSASPINPQLAPLGNYGGPTQTHLLLPNSPAVNAGDNCVINNSCSPALNSPLTTDQRGFPRLIGPTVDIGSVEVNYSFTVTSGTPQSATINSNFASPLKATLTESGLPVSGVSVTFTAPASGASGRFSGSSTATVSTDSSGVATAPTFKANGTAGGYNVTASVQGLTTTPAFSLTNTQASTTTTVTSSVNPSDFGQSVTFTATVNSAAGTPTGTVQFKDNGNNLGSPATLNGGVATFTTSSLSVGSHNITADYNGDGNFTTSSGTLSGGQTVRTQPTLTINDVSLKEGNSGTTGFTFTVTLSAASNLTVKVDYVTANGAASSGSDYAASSGTLTFNPGDTTKTVTVQVNGDAACELDETFNVNLSNPVNATVQKTQGTGTIQNDDNVTVVTNSNNSGAGSLRDVIANACPGATITFDASLVGPITLTSGELLVDKSLTITGPGANLLTVRRSSAQGTPSFRIFRVPTGVTVNISGLTISNGLAAGDGGGILNQGTLALSACAVRDNTAQGGQFTSGGGVRNDGTLTVTNSTISGNRSVSPDNSSQAGGLFNPSGTMTLTNSTVSGNTVENISGGILNNSGATLNLNSCTITANVAGASVSGLANTGTVNIRNTVVAGNSVPNSSDARGTFNSQGFNLIGKADNSNGFGSANQDQTGTIAAPLDARLGPLADNGGPTQTHALLPGSPAINAGNNCVTNNSCSPALSSAITADQRGVTRPQPANGVVDIGAFESRGFTISVTSGTPQSTPINTAFNSPLVATVSSAFNEPVAGGLVTFTAPQTGATATFTGGVTTFAAIISQSGQASATATANGTAGGPYTVTATAKGVTSSAATFSLTNTK
ncbi:MAG TPA: choice-of-anchor Q domain-containing protein, partial [Pyrinomonadaceae bacterium]